MTAAERWLNVPGWEGIYEVSDHGRVRSLDRLDRLGRRRKGRILSAPPNSDGYPHLHLMHRGAQRITRAQAGALAAALGSTFEALTGELCAACGCLPGSDGCAAGCGKAMGR